MIVLASYFWMRFTDGLTLKCIEKNNRDNRSPFKLNYRISYNYICMILREQNSYKVCHWLELEKIAWILTFGSMTYCRLPSNFGDEPCSMLGNVTPTKQLAQYLSDCLFKHCNIAIFISKLVVCKLLSHYSVKNGTHATVAIFMQSKIQGFMLLRTEV